MTTNKKERKAKNKSMICGGKSESTGSQLLNRKRDIYSLSHSLFNFNRVGTLGTKRFNYSLTLKKYRVEMEKCTIKLNHWIVIASFRFYSLGIIALLIVAVLHKEKL